MTDPLRPPGTTPRRAEPIQPDRPGRGLDQLEERNEAALSSKDAESTENALEQGQTALDNVRHP